METSEKEVQNTTTGGKSDIGISRTHKANFGTLPRERHNSKLCPLL
jgi:hypothetical protein